jgi:hypothetical protein
MNTCNSYCFRRRIFRRILWTVVCSIFKLALFREIDFFGLRVKACITQSTSSSDRLRRPVECFVSTLELVPSPKAFVIRLPHTILTPKFRLNSSNGFKVCVPLLGLCSRLFGRHCSPTDTAEQVIKAAVR